MPQGLRLDRPLGRVYFALALLGCRRAEPALLPSAAAGVSAEQVAAWVEATRPAGRAVHRFTWLFQDEQASKGGRGSARIAPPDSLRFDVAGSLGVGKGSALVVGDTAVWVVPERAVNDLVPNYPLLWALFGIARPPGPFDRLAGVSEGGRTAWRYATGADTVEYQRVVGDRIRFAAEAREAGRVVGRATVTLLADGTPVNARLIVPSGPAKLEIKFYATVPTAAFPPETWTPPRP